MSEAGLPAYSAGPGEGGHPRNSQPLFFRGRYWHSKWGG